MPYGPVDARGQVPPRLVSATDEQGIAFSVSFFIFKTEVKIETYLVGVLED